jgi:glycerol-3-phosphate dehydrogenase
MWNRNWREQLWPQIEGPWDILIIGGGITGAGILREAARFGLKVLLVEQRDFAWGTSSRSSKLVHGGLRYLKEGRLGLTWASVHERQQLLKDGPGLIDPLGCLLTVRKGDFPGRWTFEVGLTIYDLLALRWNHAYYSPQDFQMLAPHISQKDLEGGFRYGDAQTDDARLVLRVLCEAATDGASALNYTRVEKLIFEEDQVAGAQLNDLISGRQAIARARLVINATGAWADQLRTQVNGAPHIRPLRGSHLIFPAWRLPVAQSISFLHPIDRRPVFIFPWEGVTLVGTTDVDYTGPLDTEPSISPEETAYLMAAVESQFPSLHLDLGDVSSTYAGIRPVIGSGKADPSQESRDHVIWQENGLLTVTGGKLTTFRLIALDVLKAARSRLPDLPEVDQDLPVLDPVDIALPGAEGLDEIARRRLLGRYGADAPALVAVAQLGELEPIPGTQTLWAELRWAARAEAVVHLEDLLLRRTRLGLLLPQGGAALLSDIQAICQPELGWETPRWEREVADYMELWQRCYNTPAPDSVPNWRAQLSKERSLRQQLTAAAHSRRRRRIAWAGVLTFISSLFIATWWLRYLRRRPGEYHD